MTPTQFKSEKTRGFYSAALHRSQSIHQREIIPTRATHKKQFKQRHQQIKSKIDTVLVEQHVHALSSADKHQSRTRPGSSSGAPNDAGERNGFSSG